MFRDNTLVVHLQPMSVRVRQHVNPLSSKFQHPIDLPDWQTCFADLTQPLHLDIGAARGHFLLKMAQLKANWNFLGLEIRHPLVQGANSRRDLLGLKNLHYLFCNANFSLKPLLDSLPSEKLQYVTIQFPDPWFKNRHHKRRIVQPELVSILKTYLVSQGILFLQSDVEIVAQEMCACVAQDPGFERQGNCWLPENPLPVQTEREISTCARGKPVYRALFLKR